MTELILGHFFRRSGATPNDIKPNDIDEVQLETTCMNIVTPKHFWLLNSYQLWFFLKFSEVFSNNISAQF